MNNFKVGDMVVGKYKNGYVVTKEGWVGKVVSVDGNCIKVKSIYGDDSVYTVKENGFEKLEHKTTGEKIVIKNDGKTTQAIYYVNDEATIIAQATCHPDDKYNFIIGAELAFKRINEKIEKSKLYTGRVVCLKSTTPEFKKGKIYTIINGILCSESGASYKDISQLDEKGRIVNIRGVLATNSKFLEVVE